MCDDIVARVKTVKSILKLFFFYFRIASRINLKFLLFYIDIEETYDYIHDKPQFCYYLLLILF